MSIPQKDNEQQYDSRYDSVFPFLLMSLDAFVLCFLLGQFVIFLWPLYVPLASYTFYVWRRVKINEKILSTSQPDHYTAPSFDEGENFLGLLIFGGGAFLGFFVLFIMTVATLMGVTL